MIWSSRLEICQTIQLQMDRYAIISANYLKKFSFYYLHNKAQINILNFFQVKIQKDSEVRLKIIGTRVDATEIVCALNLFCLLFANLQWLFLLFSHSFNTISVCILAITGYIFFSDKIIKEIWSVAVT